MESLQEIQLQITLFEQELSRNNKHKEVKDAMTQQIREIGIMPL